MGKRYSQLSLKERSLISHLHADGLSKSKVAARLGRHVTTISRELARNGRRIGVWPGGYDPQRAQDLAARRRQWDKRFKLVRQPDLAEKLKQHLASPALSGWPASQPKGDCRLNSSQADWRLMALA